MNTYINKRTGAVITTPCVCSGGDWELEKSPQKPADKDRKKTKGTDKP